MRKKGKNWKKLEERRKAKEKPKLKRVKKCEGGKKLLWGVNIGALRDRKKYHFFGREGEMCFSSPIYTDNCLALILFCLQECAYDHIVVYDGHTTSSQILGRSESFFSINKLWAGQEVHSQLTSYGQVRKYIHN